MDKIIEDFIKALDLAGINLSKNKIKIDKLGCPHKPKKLPEGKMGIYIFKLNDKYLKIGKAGPKSKARFYNQHYNPKSSPSNLAKSILKDSGMNKYNINSDNVGNWIKNNTERIDLILDESLGIFILSYLEAFLHCKFQPKYEGFDNQMKF